MRRRIVAALAMLMGATAAISAAVAPVAFGAPKISDLPAGEASSSDMVSPGQTNASTAAEVTIPVTRARVLRRLPHDSSAFTQGLFFHQGRLFESTGGNGRSVIREVDLESGKVKRQVALLARYFGEGATAWGDEIISLTWTGGIGFRWRIKDFKQVGSFRYPGEGWGLTQDGKSLILSDGTPELRFLNPATMAEQRRVRVTLKGAELRELNELEYIGGEVWANVWQQDAIVRIDPASGAVTGIIDLSEIAAQMPRGDPDTVPNGIAYDARSKRLYITGKNWPALFEIAMPD